MISNAKLSRGFWVETIAITCYLVNLSSSVALGDKTLEEAWSGRKLCVSYLRVFGCEAYVHVPKENRKKLVENLKQNVCAHWIWRFYWIQGIEAMDFG
jgi:hypothetical protein